MYRMCLIIEAALFLFGEADSCLQTVTYLPASIALKCKVTDYLCLFLCVTATIPCYCFVAIKNHTGVTNFCAYPTLLLKMKVNILSGQ